MKNKFIILVGMVLFLVGFVSAHVGEDDYSHHGMMGEMMTGMYGGVGMIFGWLIGILFIVVLVLLIIWLIKQIQKK